MHRDSKSNVKDDDRDDKRDNYTHIETSNKIMRKMVIEILEMVLITITNDKENDELTSIITNGRNYVSWSSNFSCFNGGFQILRDNGMLHIFCRLNYSFIHLYKHTNMQSYVYT
jgi:hypothetical protein